MADKSITVANVLASSQASIGRGTAGVATTAGQTLAKYSDGTMRLFDADGAAPLNKFSGVALHGALAGQPIAFAISDPSFTPGYTVAAGEEVVGSATAGASCPLADLTSGSVPTILGLGIGSNQINLNPESAGVAIP